MNTEREWPGRRAVLDVACGIGTQALALAQRGFQVVASDLSPAAINRASLEASKRNVRVDFSVCDMRQAFQHHGGGFDLLICADNSLPHLLTDKDLLTALQQMHACLRPGGGCVVTVRDYDNEARGTHMLKPYGIRLEGSKRCLLFQVWDFEGQYYNTTFFIVEEDLISKEVKTHVVRSRYYAVSTTMLLRLMSEAGFQGVKRVDGEFYQPILVGTRNN
jgi:SAM-dependent methyltransferase